MDEGRGYFFWEYLNENTDFLCWFISNLQKDYYYKLKSFEGQPFYASELFKNEINRYDRILYALELNQYFVNKSKKSDTSIKIMNILLHDYIDSWLQEQDELYKKELVEVICNSLIYLCGFYLIVDASLDFDITEAIKGFDDEIERLELSKVERMKSLVFPKHSTDLSVDTTMMLLNNDHTIMLNLTMKQKEFNFGKQTRSLIFYDLLYYEFIHLTYLTKVDRDKFIGLLYETMILFDLIERSDEYEGLGIEFIFRNISKRLDCFQEEDLDRIHYYLINTWRAYYGDSIEEARKKLK